MVWGCGEDDANSQDDAVPGIFTTCGIETSCIAERVGDLSRAELVCLLRLLLEPRSLSDWPCDNGDKEGSGMAGELTIEEDSQDWSVALINVLSSMEPDQLMLGPFDDSLGFAHCDVVDDVAQEVSQNARDSIQLFTRTTDEHFESHLSDNLQTLVITAQSAATAMRRVKHCPYFCYCCCC